MLRNLTEEQFKLINEVYEKHIDEFRLWCENHGHEHFNEWYKDYKAHGRFKGKFAHYISKKFMDWKSANN